MFHIAIPLGMLESFISLLLCMQLCREQQSLILMLFSRITTTNKATDVIHVSRHSYHYVLIQVKLLTLPDLLMQLRAVNISSLSHATLGY